MTIVSDHEHVLTDVDHAGDEPMLLARALPGVPVLVCADRRRAGRQAEAQFGSTVHLLDDGFQHVQLWRDHFVPAAGADYPQAEHPYLGAHFEFRPRKSAPIWVNRIHCFNYAATMSHGPISGDIPAISLGAERTARGVVNGLFAEDYQRTWQRLAGWSNPELRGDEYVLDEDVSKFLADEPADAKT